MSSSDEKVKDIESVIAEMRQRADDDFHHCDEVRGILRFYAIGLYNIIHPPESSEE